MIGALLWIPAFAGMTGVAQEWWGGLCGDDGGDLCGNDGGDFREWQEEIFAGMAGNVSK